MSTIPVEEEKDLRKISDMEFANDTTSEEKAALRKWTKLAQELDGIQKEIKRCVANQKTEREKGNEASADALIRHIAEQDAKAVQVSLDVDVAKAEWETLRNQNEPVRKEKAQRVRELLTLAGLKTAQDIIDAGCTGLFKKYCFQDTMPNAQDNAKFVRENMGGARVSLTCYVGPDRYCLIHQTIGGLQFGQKAAHVDEVPFISRDLTPEEKGHATLVENVRRREGNMKDGKAILTGQRIPDDLDLEHMSIQDTEFKKQMAAAGVQPSTTVQSPQGSQAFTCPEHGALAWGCRYCIAQVIVSGALELELLIQKAKTAEVFETYEPVAPNDVESRIAEMDRKGAQAIKIFVRAVSFRRKLSMD